jgi:predicted  nucleic acid-binding Zn-ribbon protein
MATTKVKGTSKKLKELKGVKPEKITDEQLNKVQNLISSVNKLQIEVGIMESRKHSALHSIANINDKITLLQGEFEKDYGTFDIDIENGTINYPKENGEVNKKD